MRFSQKIMKNKNLLSGNNSKTPIVVNSIKTIDYPTPAKRPVFSVLDCSKIENDFGIHASNWHEGVLQAIHKLELEKQVS